MSWNYRVIKHKTAPTGNAKLDAVTPKEWYGLHEVYYDEKGEINGWIEEPEVAGETLEDLLGTVKLMYQAAQAATEAYAGDNRRKVLDAESMNKEAENVKQIGS